MTEKQDIKFNIEDVNLCEKRINLELSTTKVREVFRKVVDNYKSQTKVSGFREGKVPRSVIMKRFKEQITDSVQKHLIDEASHYALTESKDIIPIMEISKDIGSVEEGKEYKFSITFEVQPNFTLPEYKKMKLEVPAQVIKDEEIDEKIEMVLTQQASLSSVDDVAKDNDFVKCHVQCTKELDEEVAKAVNGDNRWIIMSEGGQFPGAKDLLIGKKVGDKVSGEISFPKDYNFNEQLQGTSYVFEFTVTEVQRRVPPKLDDEFLKQNNFTTIDAFKDSIRQSLIEEKKSHRDSLLAEKIVEQLLENVECSLPQKTLVSQEEHILHQMIHEKRRAS